MQAVPSSARIKEVGTVIMSGPGASQHFQGFVLKVFTPWPILCIICIWLVLLIVCIVERGNERRPLSLQRNSQNRRSSDIQAPCREQRNFLHATLWEKKRKRKQFGNEIQHKDCLWLLSSSSTGDLVIVRGRLRVRQSLSEKFYGWKLA